MPSPQELPRRRCFVARANGWQSFPAPPKIACSAFLPSDHVLTVFCKFKYFEMYWQVRGALGPVEVEMAKKERYLAGTHVVVGTPEALLEVVAGGEAQELMRHCKTIVVDEVDACFQVGFVLLY